MIFKVIHPVKVGKDLIKAGTVDLDGKQADHFLHLKVVQPAEANNEAGVMTLAEAIAFMVADEPRNEDLWAGNKPKTEPLSTLTGSKVSASQRDKAWAEYQEGQEAE